MLDAESQCGYCFIEEFRRSFIAMCWLIECHVGHEDRIAVRAMVVGV